MDRRIILVDPKLERAGIAAALRRAFGDQFDASDAGRNEPFADLLDKIH